MKEQNEIALSDIEFMRKILDDGHKKVPDQTEVMMTALIFGATVVLLCTFWFVNPDLSNDILIQARDPNLRTTIMVQMAIVLGLIGACVYGLAWRRARELQSSIDRTLKRTLTFLKFESFLPDLALKALVLFATVIVSPQYLAALLVAFIGDYVFQARFFNYGSMVRIPLGIILYGAAIELFVSNRQSLTIPLMIFSLVSATSLVSTIMKRRQRHE